MRSVVFYLTNRSTLENYDVSTICISYRVELPRDVIIEQSTANEYILMTSFLNSQLFKLKIQQSSIKSSVNFNYSLDYSVSMNNAAGREVITLRMIQPFVDTGRIQQEMLTENKPCPPIIRFVSYRNGTLRLLTAGKCPGCQSTHLRNICIAQFVSFLCEPFIKSKFITVRHVGFVCTRDEDFVEVVEFLGAVMRQLVDEKENVPMMEYKKLMLDGHPDIDCYIKGLISRDRNAPMV